MVATSLSFCYRIDKIAETQKESPYTSQSTTEDDIARAEELSTGTRSDSVPSANSTRHKEFAQGHRYRQKNGEKEFKSLVRVEQNTHSLFKRLSSPNFNRTKEKSEGTVF